MFVLEGNQMYVWHKIFIVVSLDRFLPFVADVDFPVPNKYLKVQQLARDFAGEFAGKEPVLFSKGEPSASARHLFDRFLDILVHNLGQEDAILFCDWGNLLKLDSKIEKALLGFWSSDKTKPIKTGIKQPQFEHDFGLYLLQALLMRCDAYLNGIFLALDNIEKLPKSDWEVTASELYNYGRRIHGSISSLELSPFEFLEGIITYCTLMKLLKQIAGINRYEEILIEADLFDNYTQALDLLA